MMGDLWLHLPTPHWVFSSFWPKMALSLCPTLPLHLILPWGNFSFCFPRWKKSLKGNILLMWKRRGKKNSRSTKRHQNRWVQNYFEQWKKGLNRYIASDGEYFEGDWRINIQFLNKYIVFWSPPIYYFMRKKVNEKRRQLLGPPGKYPKW